MTLALRVAALVALMATGACSQIAVPVSPDCTSKKECTDWRAKPFGGGSGEAGATP